MATGEERFANLRAQMWWQMREDLRRGQIALPNDQELVVDLVTPRWWTHGGKIFVAAKEEIRRRLGRSPDKGDAAVYGNWVRDRRRLKVEEPEVAAFSREMLEASRERLYKLSKRRSRRRAALGFDYGDGY